MNTYKSIQYKKMGNSGRGHNCNCCNFTISSMNSKSRKRYKIKLKKMIRSQFKIRDRKTFVACLTTQGE